MIDAEIQNGQVTKRYIFINLRPVAVIEYENDDKNDSTLGNKYAGNAAIYAIHTDHLGTPQAITDSQQAVVWRADYATFGKATVQARVVDSKIKTASSGIISNANAATTAAKPFEFNLRFAGQYEDVESGYHYNWHRYYDPSTGRYLTPDPIGLAGGLNGYGYAGQDPLRSIDPWGLKNYVIGSTPPPIVPDVGAGIWNSETPKLITRTQKLLIQTGLGAVSGMPNAVAHLKHYFDNTGTEYTIDMVNLLKSSQAATDGAYEEFDAAVAFAEANAKCGQSTAITSSKLTGKYANQSDSKDWYFASGGFSLWGAGVVTLDANGNYSMDFTLNYFDKYNWDGGKSVTIGGITITDEFMANFHKQGLAKEFDMSGKITQTVTWKKGSKPRANF